MVLWRIGRWEWSLNVKAKKKEVRSVNKRKWGASAYSWKTLSHNWGTKEKVFSTLSGFKEHYKVEENFEDIFVVVLTSLLFKLF